MLNFIIYARPYDFYDVAYYDLMNLPSVTYIRDIRPQNAILRILFKIHQSEKINHIVPLPFKQVWFPSFEPKLNNRGKDVCFIFFGGWLYKPIFKQYAEWLRRKYVDARFVCYFQDLLGSNVGLNKLKNTFDIIASYDKYEASKFGLLYLQTPYSKINLEYNSQYECDAYFVGKSKNRLEKIINMYDLLTSKGLDCQFYVIIDSKREFIAHRKGIHYVDSMPYLENLNHVINSKCVVEIMQSGATGFTLRTWEAIIYDKHLLTDNKSIVDSEFYISDYMHVEDINLSSLLVRPNYPDELKALISPKKLLKKIEKELSRNEAIS